MKRLKTLTAYDLKQGIRGEWFKYLLAFLLALTGGWQFGREYLPYVEYEVLGHKAGILDYLAFDLWGLPPLSPDRDMKSDMPMLWLLLMILVTLAVGYHLYQQSYGFGRNIMLKGQSRTGWWLSKCIWCSVSVLLLMLVLILGALCCGGIHGMEFRNVSWDIFGLAKWMEGTPPSGLESILIVVVLPILTISAIALWQQVLSLLVQPVVAVLVIIGYYVAASLYQSPLLIGNYAMICRNECVAAGGWNVMNGLLIVAAAYILAVVAGIIVVKRKDFCRKYKCL